MRPVKRTIRREDLTVPSSKLFCQPCAAARSSWSVFCSVSVSTNSMKPVSARYLPTSSSNRSVIFVRVRNRWSVGSSSLAVFLGGLGLPLVVPPLALSPGTFGFRFGPFLGLLLVGFGSVASRAVPPPSVGRGLPKPGASPAERPRPGSPPSPPPKRGAWP